MDPIFIADDIDFLKSQVDHHIRSVEFYKDQRDQDRVERHSGILRRFKALIEKVSKANALVETMPSPLPSTVSSEVGSRFGDLDELPDELRTQLVSAQFDALEQLIRGILQEDLNGVGTIDEILVAVYRRTSKIENRDQLANKMYRMTKKNLVVSVPRRKGIYALPGVDVSAIQGTGGSSSDEHEKDSYDDAFA
ncbi:MAG: hypothetical protein ABJN75_23190 [Hoeflea sp.]|uniref:hypothetical protein n=1 Tax=Hoeflea sp. TaxID=1940281 RepID=UPI003297BDEE